MKKILFVVLLALSFIAGNAAAAEKREALKEGEAGIIAVKGDVKIIPPSGMSVDAKAGKKIDNGSTVKVGKGAQAQIAYSPDIKKSILLQEKTEAVITPKNDTKINIKKGKIFAVLDKVKPGAKFQFETPHALAGVRGTTPEIWAEDKTTVFTHDGEMGARGITQEAENKNEFEPISKGEKGYVVPNQPIWKEPLSEEDISRGRQFENTVNNNVRDFREMHGGAFEARTTPLHAPQRAGGGSKGAAGSPLRKDDEFGPQGPGGGFMSPTGREFSDQRFDNKQREPSQLPPRTEPTRDESTM